MSLTDDELREYAETTVRLADELPGRLRYIDVPGVEGRVTCVSHPLANLVSAARLEPSTADEAIDRVMHAFRTEGTVAGWITSSASTPPDLGSRLEAKGWARVQLLDVLCMRGLGALRSTNPDADVREVGADEVAEAVGMMASSFGVPEPVMRLLNDAYSPTSSRARVRTYFVYWHGKPVSWGTTVYVPGVSLVQLGGAATLADHRGKGIYSTLVAKRLADAAADGIDSSLIQAVHSTSSPICKKLGFEQIGSMDFWAWSP